MLGGVTAIALAIASSGRSRPTTQPAVEACRHSGDGASGGPQAPHAAQPPDPDVNPSCLRAADAADAARFDAELASRIGSSADGLAAAIDVRDRLASRGPKVPGGSARWQPAGTGPLVADNQTYPTIATEGYANLAGRVGSFAYDAARGRVYAAASQGGVWESRDLGQTWRSIGDGLPTQIVGAVGYSRARGGTVIAATGDNAFGAYTYGGLGIFISTNDGRTWVRSRGVPNGALGFKIAVDPSDPSVVYVATGFGLYRSADGGQSFVNEVLPTGRCAGNSLQTDCFLANVVTDVAVQAPDHFGHSGGAVLAAIGWRSGAQPNADGSPESPANGLYSSSTGLPGTFQRLPMPGFTTQSRIGRIALGVATGPDQNHGYVYAEVQDALLFNTQKLEGLDLPSLPDPLGLGINLTKTATVLNGVYVSNDFGRSWREMADYHLFELPINGSTQTTDLGFELLGAYGPGVQAWYNEWIQPDPTRQYHGAPTRVLTGLEELWENTATSQPANGLELFRALTQYNGIKTPDCLLQLLQQLVCNALAQPSVRAVHPDQHAGLWIPRPDGGVTLLIGNDGGAYREDVRPGQELTVGGFGNGAQTGFQTLEPYGVAMAKDGTIYAGLQDNGNIKITADRSQTETLGGDGIFTAVDPNNSNVAYDTLPSGNVFVTTDGGKSWRIASPTAITNPPFYTPLAMDPLNANHITTGGRQVLDSTSGPKTAQSSNGVTIDPGTDWQLVFDLGTRLSPGNANATGGGTQNAENQVSAVATRGPDEYVGYCGDCDPVRDNALFGSGIATNVGGSAAPAAGSPSGWHIAAARGLPHRIITSVAIDPENARHIFVTLGSSTLRPYVPPGALGNDGVALRAGEVYESYDAGNSFVSRQGNLPSIGAAWVAFHRRQLVVANGVGVFASTTNVSATKGRALRYGVLGKGLPHVPVFSLAFSPANPDLMVAATFGRGVWTYRFR